MIYKIFFPLIFIFAFSLTGMHAQHDWDFEDWDENDDRLISEEEFEKGYIHSGYFSLWDANDDNFIAKDEMKKAWKTYYMDLDDDGVFEAWDVNVDGTLSRDEFIDGAFIIYDADRDGNIDAAEYREYRADDK